MTIGKDVKILRVDLTKGSIEVQTLDDDFYRLYPGGKALAGYILLNELPPHTDPLSPENVLVIASGLMTGAPVSTATRYVVSARSPLTNAYGESEAGGFWGPELKQAGFEAIVVKGASPEPVYLSIKDGQVELRPADHLWGRTTHEVQEAIREELEDKKVRVLQIGIAGENMVRFAGLTNELRHFNGRNGMGAVMGSKKLRAVAVRGTLRYKEEAYDPETLSALGKKLARQVKEHPASWSLQQTGTPVLVEPLHNHGMLPTRNFRQGAFDGKDGLKWETYEEQIYTGNKSCYACAIRCKREVKVGGKPSPYGGPEFETVGAFGSDCGVSDIHAVAKANELCNAYMLDSISTGATIAFAMECFENGLIGPDDTDGIELRFGNAEAVVQMVEKIARRDGFGDLLAEGTLRAAQKIGWDAIQYAMQVKGQEMPMHEPRGKYNIGMSYAISEIGADHLVVAHDAALANEDSLSYQAAIPLGIRSAEPVLSLNEGKMHHFYVLERWGSFEKASGYCFFGPAPRSFIHPDDVLLSVNAATGWDVTIKDLLDIGERGTNMARIFNMREGFTRADDTLPERLFGGLENGKLAGMPFPRDDFQEALSNLYELKGWDRETGVPGRERLESLGMGWAADLLLAD